MDETTQNAIDGLQTLNVSQLQARYRELFGEPSPSSNRQHLFRRLAWRLQARVAGDLSDRARRRAAELADDADLRLRAPASFWRSLRTGKGPEPVTARDPRLPAPGTVLKRLYRQRSIEVQVLDHGFQYNGKSYTSLSAIAHQVTGTRWNGFLFFGLIKVTGHE